MTQWELSDGNAALGTLDEPEVVQRIRGGALSAETLCRPAGSESWRGLRTHAPFALALEQLAGLKPATAPLKLDRQRILMLVAAAAGAAATFLPWVKMPMVGSMLGVEHRDGLVSAALFAVTIAIVLLRDRSRPLSSASGAAASLPSLVAAGMAGHKIFRVDSFVSELGKFGPFASFLKDSFGPGIGLYIIALAGLLVPLFWLSLGIRKQR